MLNEMKAVLYYLAVDMRFSFKVFWSILIGSLIAMAIIVLSFDTTMVVTTSIPIYIFCGITGFLTTKETFPYCIKLGATRNYYILSVLVYCAVVAAVFSMIHVLLYNVMNQFVATAVNGKLLTYHTIEATTLTNTWYNQLFVDTTICFLLISLGFCLGTIFYRFGMIGGFSAMALLAIVMIMPGTRSYVVDVFVLDMEGMKLGLNFLALVGFALLAYLPNWGMIRKASTVPGDTR